MSMMAGMVIAALIGIIGLVISGWFQRVPSARDVATLKQPHRNGKITVVVAMLIWFAGYLLLAAPVGKGRDFFFSGGTYVVWFLLLLASLGIYAILAFLLTDRFFSGRYRYLTWISRKLHRRSA
jgi:hypothetical protein